MLAGEEVALDAGGTRFRSSFYAAVLRTLPLVQSDPGKLRKVRLDPSYPSGTDVLGELESRLGAYAELVAAGGPSEVTPGLLRELGLYGGASGVWCDTARTAGIGGERAVAADKQALSLAPRLGATAFRMIPGASAAATAISRATA